MKKLLFLSNGHGEDQAAARIIKLLPADLDISVYPLVGEGKAFEGMGVNVLGPKRALASGGFSLRNIFSLPKDLYGGLATLFFGQLKKLNGMKGQFDLVVAIGDIVPLIGAMLVKAPFIFVGVNKSDYYHTFGYSYTPWEKWLLKKYAKVVYARDEITANNLIKEGINAVYAGNPLMDGIASPLSSPSPAASENSFPSPSEMERGVMNEVNDGVRIGFLPGTRKEDIPKNLEDFQKIKAELLKLDKNIKFLVTPTPFEEVIYKSTIVIGLSGTGNEQAAGIGKPVLAFPGRGAQYSRKFALAQKELLGEALTIVERDPVKVANEVWEILNDRERYAHMALTGKKRMGKRGAVDAIGREIINLLK